MKVTHINHKHHNGASQAAYRIHKGLLMNNVDSKLLVRSDEASGRNVQGPRNRYKDIYGRFLGFVDNSPANIIYDPKRQFSTNWTTDTLTDRTKETNPDIVNLHWIADGAVQIEALKDLDIPIVWRIPDMWPFTGGCHYTSECTHYKNSCGKCPVLESNKSVDLSKINWYRKKRILERLDITIVPTSDWLSNKVGESSLMKDLERRVIPNCIDTTVYRPYSQKFAREVFNLMNDIPIVLFGAQSVDNPRKGFDILLTALREFKNRFPKKSLQLVSFGNNNDNVSNELDCGFDTRFLGQILDDRLLAVLYSAADVMIVPSRQEAFGQTSIEAQACGTPVVTFDSTGTADTVQHLSTGYIAENENPDDLAEGIEKLLFRNRHSKNISKQSRDWAIEMFSIDNVAEQYSDLYNEILS